MVRVCCSARACCIARICCIARVRCSVRLVLIWLQLRLFILDEIDHLVPSLGEAPVPLPARKGVGAAAY